MLHPWALTVEPIGVFGHWSWSSGIPSPSVSFSNGAHPVASTVDPAGVAGH
ncbi:hypothetical protein C943_01940 [Mariniradius saccharolyticus AK6]|uniref:Uncharacterized protein n=1 Tax=Mariniradius saccharolyticus AK6 TaxID=1239962 RepID=M7X9R0_9BACT|nr:hypothetical protein C943_01940 [Mariniradius saccharolyticus AK6]